MKTTLKSYALIPAVAALLVLGPLSMQSSPSAAEPKSAPTSNTPKSPAEGNSRPALPSIGPKTPDLMQVLSALAGALLLGVGGLFVLRRLRGEGRPGKGPLLISLRQTLRLPAGQTLYAIEFDDRLLLVGKGDRGLTLLDSGKASDRNADEAEVLARHAGTKFDHMVADEDLGAVPKNLVIPRPDPKPAPRLPTPPAVTSTPRHRVGLNDFRTLLQKVGRS